MKAAVESSPPLFGWEVRRRFQWSMFGFVLLSATAHAVTFFLFQVADPTRVTVPPPAPEVSLLLPTTPENRSLLRRIEADDPALVAAATSVQPPGLLELKYRPSYETVRTAPRTVAESSDPIPIPPAKDPLAIIRSSRPAGALASAATPPIPTRLSFSPELQTRAPQSSPRMSFKKRGTAPLEPAKFLIGVTDRGEVRFVFLQRPSGDPALDQQAAAQLPEIDFAHATAPITWGFATVSWGDDAYGENQGEPTQNPKGE
jgi:hypothetical protein